MIAKKHIYFILCVLISLLISCNAHEAENEASSDRAVLRVSLSDVTSNPTESEIKDVRFLIFGKSGVIEENLKFSSSEINPAKISALVETSKRLCAVANADTDLDSKLSKILTYSDLKALLLTKRASNGSLDEGLISNVLTAEKEFDLTSDGQSLQLSLVRAYCKVVLYLYIPNNSKYKDIALTKAEFKNLASVSSLFDVTKYPVLTQQDLYVSTKEWSPGTRLGLCEEIPSKEPLSSKLELLAKAGIQPVISYYPYEQNACSDLSIQESALELWAPKITIDAVIDGISTKYFIPIQSRSLVRNNAYIIIGKVSGFGDETEGIAINTNIVPWNKVPVSFNYADPYLKENTFHYDVDGREGQASALQGTPIQIRKGEKVKFRFKVVSVLSDVYWNVSLSDGLHFRCTPVFGKVEANKDCVFEVTPTTDLADFESRECTIRLSVGGMPVYDKPSSDPSRKQVAIKLKQI